MKESESETSSLSEIDVLAGIRNRSLIGLGGADQELLKLNGYETKILNGEVVFTSKNGFSVVAPMRITVPSSTKGSK